MYSQFMMHGQKNIKLCLKEVGVGRRMLLKWILKSVEGLGLDLSGSG